MLRIGIMTTLYFDDSRHPQRGFELGAFVIADQPVDAHVRHVLVEHGLDPNTDEYKSGRLFSGIPRMQSLRRAMMQTLQNYCGVSIVVVPSGNPLALGHEALLLLTDIFKHPDVEESSDVFFDQSLFTSVQAANAAASDIGLTRCSTQFEQNSRDVRGIQLADLAAHTCATMLSETIGHTTKILAKINPSTGETFEAPLGWELWYKLRRHFLGRPMDPWDSVLRTEPFGLRISPECPQTLAAGARERFSELFLGCVW